MTQVFVIAALSLFLLTLAFSKQLSTNFKTIMLISEQFPQIPLKPLSLLTEKPSHKHVSTENEETNIVADVFSPANSTRTPAIIIAMGVKTKEEDKPIILNLSENLSRLGYTVIWPRSEKLDQGTADLEDPGVFIWAFNYLENLDQVQNNRISFVGFSVGSSIAMVAAEDPQINEKVHALVFFGGYYNLIDYLEELATKKAEVGGKEVAWDPGEGAINHVREILETKGSSKTSNIFLGEITQQEFQELVLTSPEIANLSSYSPSENIDSYLAPTFILHDKQDNFVHYSQSLDLKEELEEDQIKAFTIVSLFEHVQPQSDFSPQIAIELAKLYRFLYKALSFI